LGAALLEPTRIYVKPVLALREHVSIKGLAHITGGGLVENVPRILPDTVMAVLDRSTWTRPAVFDWLQRAGEVADAEMHRVFNCGIGMVVVVAPAHAQAAIEFLTAQGERAFCIGAIAPRASGDGPQTVVR
jgi:phosphoribosylformylglycinamidine cyclo-ligase